MPASGEKMDFALARHNMVESQLRTNRIVDEGLLDSLRTIPREQFVPKTRHHLAYLDEDVPLGQDRFLTEPMVMARMIQALELTGEEVVLVIGAGTGYSAAVISRLAATVFALENDPQLASEAGSHLTNLGLDNVVVVEGPLQAGWPADAPFDAILIDGAVAEIPEAIVSQLRDGGRLVTVEKQHEQIGHVSVVTKFGETASSRPIMDASVPYLDGFRKKPSFVF